MSLHSTSPYPEAGKAQDLEEQQGRPSIGHLRRLAVGLLLVTQAGLLAYSATRHSPTHLEPAFLVSGISHWKLGRFELYRVNPPLVRMIAAIPVLAVGCETDWSQFHDAPGSRAEFPLGEDFVKANGPALIPLFFYARWACIPFNLMGAYFAYRWAKELYRNAAAGFVTLVLYVFEPNLLAHGELITPDGACTAFGILAGYTFWRWLKQPTWGRACLAGLALGFAELTKLSWLILFGLWPVLWLIWNRIEPETVNTGHHKVEGQFSTIRAFRSLFSALRSSSTSQLALLLLLAIYVINLGYAFDGFGTQLSQFKFVSATLTGLSKAGSPGNRFQDTWLGELPIPLPKQYVLGFDSQKKDLETFGHQSYLRGEWKETGWWYYYLYGLLVKVPCGTWGLFGFAVLAKILTRNGSASFRDELVLLAPALTLLVVVSSQTTFNIHLRYVFPSLAFFLIFCGRCSLYFFPWRISLVTLAPFPLLFYSLISSISSYPHNLAYFNDFVGGPTNGHKHLLGSSFDWGQDLLLLAKCRDSDAIKYPVLIYSPYCPLYLFPEIALPRFSQSRVAAESLQLNGARSQLVIWTKSVLQGGLTPIWTADFTRQSITIAEIDECMAGLSHKQVSRPGLPGYTSTGPIMTVFTHHYDTQPISVHLKADGQP